MNSFELNKVAGAVLGTLLFAFGTGFVAELIYTPKPAGNAGYALPGASKEDEHGAGGESAAAKEEPIATRLAHADAEKGKAGTKACQGCHNFEEGAGAKVGPDLYNVVERPKGSVSGFDYSAGMKEKGGNWTYEDLDHFLTKPSAFIKGTKMSYQGISAPQERANVIAYLRTLSKDPKPLPAAEKKEEAKPAAGDKKPAEGDKKPADAEKKGEAKPADKAADKKPDAAKPAEADKKPAEAKPAEAKPADTKPADAKPAEKPAETKPADQKPAGDAKPADAKPADNKPAEGEKKDDQGATQKPSDRPADQPADKPITAPADKPADK